jgi:hypothetical protein
MKWSYKWGFVCSNESASLAEETPYNKYTQTVYINIHSFLSVTEMITRTVNDWLIYDLLLTK